MAGIVAPVRAAEQSDHCGLLDLEILAAFEVFLRIEIRRSAIEQIDADPVGNAAVEEA